MCADKNHCTSLKTRYDLHSTTRSIDNHHGNTTSIKNGDHLKFILGQTKESWFDDLTTQQLKQKPEIDRCHGWSIINSPLSTPRINRLFQKELQVGTSPRNIRHSSPFDHGSLHTPLPPFYPSPTDKWEKPLLGSSPSPISDKKVVGFSQGSQRTPSSRVLSLGQDDSGFVWTNSLFTPPRDPSNEGSVFEDVLVDTSKVVQDTARALFSPGNRLDSTSDSITTLDNTIEENSSYNSNTSQPHISEILTHNTTGCQPQIPDDNPPAAITKLLPPSSGNSSSNTELLANQLGVEVHENISHSSQSSSGSEQVDKETKLSQDRLISGADMPPNLSSDSAEKFKQRLIERKHSNLIRRSAQSSQVEKMRSYVETLEVTPDRPTMNRGADSDGNLSPTFSQSSRRKRRTLKPEKITTSVEAVLGDFFDTPSAAVGKRKPAPGVKRKSLEPVPSCKRRSVELDETGDSNKIVHGHRSKKSLYSAENVSDDGRVESGNKHGNTSGKHESFDETKRSVKSAQQLSSILSSAVKRKSLSHSEKKVRFCEEVCEHYSFSETKSRVLKGEAESNPCKRRQLIKKARYKDDRYQKKGDAGSCKQINDTKNEISKARSATNIETEIHKAGNTSSREVKKTESVVKAEVCFKRKSENSLKNEACDTNEYLMKSERSVKVKTENSLTRKDETNTKTEPTGLPNIGMKHRSMKVDTCASELNILKTKNVKEDVEIEMGLFDGAMVHLKEGKMDKTLMKREALETKVEKSEEEVEVNKVTDKDLAADDLFSQVSPNALNEMCNVASSNELGYVLKQGSPTRKQTDINMDKTKTGSLAKLEIQADTKMDTTSNIPTVDNISSGLKCEKKAAESTDVRFTRNTTKGTSSSIQRQKRRFSYPKCAAVPKCAEEKVFQFRASQQDASKLALVVPVAEKDIVKPQSVRDNTDNSRTETCKSLAKQSIKDEKKYPRTEQSPIHQNKTAHNIDSIETRRPYVEKERKNCSANDTIQSFTSANNEMGMKQVNEEKTDIQLHATSSKSSISGEEYGHKLIRDGSNNTCSLSNPKRPSSTKNPQTISSHRTPSPFEGIQKAPRTNDMVNVTLPNMMGDCSSELRMQHQKSTPGITQFVGFQTAGGKALSMSVDAIGKASKLFEEDLTHRDDAPVLKAQKCKITTSSPNKTIASSTLGFQTSGGKAFNMSTDGIEKASKLLEEDKSDEDHQPVSKASTSCNMATAAQNRNISSSTLGFQTAGGKAFSMTSDAIEKASRLFDEDTTPLDHQPLSKTQTGCKMETAPPNISNYAKDCVNRSCEMATAVLNRHTVDGAISSCAAPTGSTSAPEIQNRNANTKDGAFRSSSQSTGMPKPVATANGANTINMCVDKEITESTEDEVTTIPIGGEIITDKGEVTTIPIGGEIITDKDEVTTIPIGGEIITGKDEVTTIPIGGEIITDKDEVTFASFDGEIIAEKDVQATTDVLIQDETNTEVGYWDDESQFSEWPEDYDVENYADFLEDAENDIATEEGDGLPENAKANDLLDGTMERQHTTERQHIAVAVQKQTSTDASTNNTLAIRKKVGNDVPKKANKYSLLIGTHERKLVDDGAAKIDSITKKAVRNRHDPGNLGSEEDTPKHEIQPSVHTTQKETDGEAQIPCHKQSKSKHMERKYVENGDMQDGAPEHEVGPGAFQGFCTAAGSKIQLTKLSLDKGLALLKDTADDNAHPYAASETDGRSASVGGFCCASGSEIQPTSKSARDKGQALLKDTAEDTVQSYTVGETCGSSMPIAGFCTAAGSSIQLSKTALDRGMALLKDADEDTIQSDTGKEVSRSVNAVAESTNPKTRIFPPGANVPQGFRPFKPPKCDQEMKACVGFSAANKKMASLASSNRGVTKCANGAANITDHVSEDSDRAAAGLPCDNDESTFQTSKRSLAEQLQQELAGDGPEATIGEELLLLKTFKNRKLKEPVKTSRHADTKKPQASLADQLHQELANTEETVGLDDELEFLKTFKAKRFNDLNKAVKPAANRTTGVVSKKLNALKNPQSSRFPPGTNVPQGFRPFKPLKISGRTLGKSGGSCNGNRYPESRCNDWEPKAKLDQEPKISHLKSIVRSKEHDKNSMQQTSKCPANQMAINKAKSSSTDQSNTPLKQGSQPEPVHVTNQVVASDTAGNCLTSLTDAELSGMFDDEYEFTQYLSQKNSVKNPSAVNTGVSSAVEELETGADKATSCVGSSSLQSLEEDETCEETAISRDHRRKVEEFTTTSPELGSSDVCALQGRDNLQTVQTHGHHAKHSQTISEQSSEDVVNANNDHPGVCGFKTAAGNEVEVSNEALQKVLDIVKAEEADTSVDVHNSACYDDTRSEALARPPIFVGFCTASGKKATVSEKSLKHAKAVLESSTIPSASEGSTSSLLDGNRICPAAPEDEVTKDEVIQVQAFDGFAIASGEVTSTSVSNESLKHTREVLDNVEMDQEFERTSTVSKCEANTIDDSLSHVAAPEDIQTIPGFGENQTKPDILTNPEASSNGSVMLALPVKMAKVPPFQGFTTASGKLATVSEKSIRHAKKIFDELPTVSDAEEVEESEQKVTSLDKTIDRSGESGSMIPTVPAIQSCSDPLHTQEIEDKLTEMPTAFGFTTASGNKVDVSIEALQHAKGVLDDADTMDIRKPPCSKPFSGFSTTSGCLVPVSNKVLKHAKKVLNDANNSSDQTSNPKPLHGFSTASGNTVNVSKEALDHVKGLLNDAVTDELTDVSRSTPLGPEHVVGFQTASGITVNISNEALKHAKGVLDDAHDDVGKKFESFSTASGNLVKVSDKALKHAKGVLDDAHDGKIPGPGKSEGFSTASGNLVKVSDGVLKHAKGVLDETHGDVGKFPRPGKFEGFSTASGNLVKVSDSALHHAKGVLDDEDNISMESSHFGEGFGFSTASGKSVSVSDKALKHARQLHMENEDESSVTVPEVSLVNSDASSAVYGNAANSVRDGEHPSKEHTRMMNTRTTNVPCPSKDEPRKVTQFSGFSTASGSTVDISDSALLHARAVLDNNTDDVSEFTRKKPQELLNAGNRVPVFSGFSTASGSTVDISDTALLHARAVLDNNTDVDETDFIPTTKEQELPIAGDEESNKSLLNTATTASKDSDVDDFAREVPEMMTIKATDTYGQMDTDTPPELSRGSGSSYSGITDTVPVASHSGRSGFSGCRGDDRLANKRQRLDLVTEKQLFSTGQRPSTVRRKPLRSCPETTYADRRHPGFRQFKPVFSKHLAPEPKRTIESLLQDLPYASKDNTKSNIGAKPTFQTPYKASTTNNQKLKAEQDKPSDTKEMIPIFFPRSTPRPKNNILENSSIDKAGKQKKSNEDTVVSRNTGTISLPLNTMNGVKMTGDTVSSTTGTNDETARDIKASIHRDIIPDEMVALTEGASNRNLATSDLNIVNETSTNAVKNISITDHSLDIPHKSVTKGTNEHALATETSTMATNDISPSTNELSLVTNDTSPSTNDLSLATNNTSPSTNDLSLATNNISLATNDLSLTTNTISLATNDLDQFSQDDDEDMYYCLLIEARSHQQEIIEQRKGSSVRPSTGRWLERKANAAWRWSLMEVVDGNGHLPEQCDGITAQNTGEFKFCMADYYSKPTTNVLVGDGGYLVPDDAGFVGKQEFYKALLTVEGVDSGLISADWVYNHYRWIVWKLAAYQLMCSVFNSRCLTPEVVMLQLKYRYDREIDLTQRSCIKKIYERDDTPGKRLVLCVAEVRYTGEDGVVTSRPRTALDAQVQLYITDGWYGIPAQLDVPLTDLVRSGKIYVGQKLCISGAELVGGEDACTPLEAPASLMLKIGCNSTRPAAWDSRLGYQDDPRPLCVPLTGLAAEGGLVGVIDAIVVRKYPMMYMEKLAGGGCVFRNQRNEDRALEEYQARKHTEMEKLYSHIEQQEGTHNIHDDKAAKRQKFSRSYIEELQTGQEIYEAVESSCQPDIVQNYLSEYQLEMLYEYKREIQSQKQMQLNSKFQAAWIDKQETFPERQVTPVLKFRLAGCALKDMDTKTSTILTVWRPASEISDLQEGHRYKIYSLNTSASRSKYCGHPVQLTATKQTRFRRMNIDENFLDSLFEPREVLLVADVKHRQPAFGELDFVGLVIRVTSTGNMDSSSSCELVYLADSEGDVLVIRFWNGTKAYGADLFSAGNTVCCCNLLDKGSYRSRHLPTVDVSNELTYISNKPNNSLQRKALQRLNAVSKDKKTFSAKCQSHLDEILGHVNTVTPKKHSAMDDFDKILDDYKELLDHEATTHRQTVTNSGDHRPFNRDQSCNQGYNTANPASNTAHPANVRYSVKPAEDRVCKREVIHALPAESSVCSRQSVANQSNSVLANQSNSVLKNQSNSATSKQTTTCSVDTLCSKDEEFHSDSHNTTRKLQMDLNSTETNVPSTIRTRSNHTSEIQTVSNLKTKNHTNAIPIGEEPIRIVTTSEGNQDSNNTRGINVDSECVSRTCVKDCTAIDVSYAMSTVACGTCDAWPTETSVIVSTHTALQSVGTKHQETHQQRSNIQGTNEQQSSQQHESNIQGTNAQHKSQQGPNKQGTNKQDETQQQGSNIQGANKQDETQQGSNAQKPNEQHETQQESNAQKPNEQHSSQQGETSLVEVNNEGACMAPDNHDETCTNEQYSINSHPLMPSTPQAVSERKLLPRSDGQGVGNSEIPSTPISQNRPVSQSATPSSQKKTLTQTKLAKLMTYSSPSVLSPLNTRVPRSVNKRFKPPAFKKM